MIKSLRLFFLAILFGVSAAHAQHLTITGITGIPLNDTAYESVNLYNGSVTIFNAGNSMYDTIDVFVKANQRPVHTIYSSIGTDSIPTQDSVTFQFSYHFSSLNYDDGDNIVVIWPAARNVPTTADTLISHIYFQSINGINDFGNSAVKIYPNPFTEYLYLDGMDKIQVKRVRISDASGRTCYEGLPAGKTIFIRYLKSGTYFISIEKTDGSRKVITMVKN